MWKSKDIELVRRGRCEEQQDRNFAFFEGLINQIVYDNNTMDR